MALFKKYFGIYGGKEIYVSGFRDLDALRKFFGFLKFLKERDKVMELEDKRILYWFTSREFETYEGGIFLRSFKGGLNELAEKLFTLKFYFSPRLFSHFFTWEQYDISKDGEGSDMRIVFPSEVAGLFDIGLK